MDVSFKIFWCWFFFLFLFLWCLSFLLFASDSSFKISWKRVLLFLCQVITYCGLKRINDPLEQIAHILTQVIFLLLCILLWNSKDMFSSCIWTSGSLRITISDITTAYLISDQRGQGLHHEDDHEQHDDQDDTSSNNHDCIISGGGNIHLLVL